jgi:hypothetical protein
MKASPFSPEGLKMTADWRPIETAPKDTEILLFLMETQDVVVAEYLSSGAQPGWYAWGLQLLDPLAESPSHWMPLPAPPAEVQQMLDEIEREARMD